MDAGRSAEGDASRAGVGMLWPTPVLAPTLAWGAGVLLHATVVTPVTAAIAAELAALVIGLPAVVWLLDHQRRGLVSWLVVGVASGLVPVALLVASASLGLWWRGGLSYLQWVLRHGAPVPALGTFAWPRYLTFAGVSGLVGAITLAAHWMVVRPRVR